MKALQQFLRPEFINRVDEIVYFNKLTEENFLPIARLMLDELRASLKEKGLSGVGGHDDDRVFKIYFSAVGVGNLTVVQNLQQHVQYYFCGKHRRGQDGAGKTAG